MVKVKNLSLGIPQDYRIDALLHYSKKEGKGQESIQSSTTSDPGYQGESDNFTIRHQLDIISVNSGSKIEGEEILHLKIWGIF